LKSSMARNTALLIFPWPRRRRDRFAIARREAESLRTDGTSFCNLARAAALSVLIASTAFVSAASAQSFTDKLKDFFGGKKEDQPPIVDPGEPLAELACPEVTIRAGASTYAVAAPGKQAIGNDVRYQATITKMARECIRAGDSITARIGIQGRVIAGPAGAPNAVEVPVRVAVVQGGIGEKVIATKAYRTTVTMAEDESASFSFVAEDLVYPMPAPNVADKYIFYVGFDPQLVGSDKPKPAKKKK
jgi:hypothetical protein